VLTRSPPSPHPPPLPPPRPPHSAHKQAQAGFAQLMATAPDSGNGCRSRGTARRRPRAAEASAQFSQSCCLSLGPPVTLGAARWLALLPHSARDPGSIPGLGHCLCGACTFSPCVRGFPPGAPVSSHSPKEQRKLQHRNRPFGPPSLHRPCCPSELKPFTLPGTISL